MASSIRSGRGEQHSQRPWRAASVAFVAFVAAVALPGLGAAAQAGAAPLQDAHLLQPGQDAGRSTATTPSAHLARTAPVQPLNLINTCSANINSLSLRSQSFAPQGATYDPQNNDALTVNWSGASLQLYGYGPIAARKIYVDTVSVSGSESCGGPGSFSTVRVDQFALDPTGQVQSVALQFLCIGGSLGSVVFATVAVGATPSTPGQGYYLYGFDGSMAGFGNDECLQYLGGLGFTYLNQPVVGMATTPDGRGYWMAAGDGGVFAFGDAPFEGSVSGSIGGPFGSGPGGLGIFGPIGGVVGIAR